MKGVLRSTGMRGRANISGKRLICHQKKLEFGERKVAFSLRRASKGQKTNLAMRNPNPHRQSSCAIRK